MLIKLDVADKKNRKDVKSVDFGFGIKYELKRLIDSKMVTSMQVFQFKKETLEFLGSVCNHAMETTPLQSLFTRCLKFFTPNFIVESSRSCKLKFEKIRENLVSCKQLPSREADTAKLEFSNFLSTTVKENKDSFVKFDKENDRSYIFIGSFSLIPINLLRWERCSKC